jgi:hypothetical protein
LEIPIENSIEAEK